MLHLKLCLNFFTIESAIFKKNKTLLIFSTIYLLHNETHARTKIYRIRNARFCPHLFVLKDLNLHAEKRVLKRVC